MAGHSICIGLSGNYIAMVMTTVIAWVLKQLIQFCRSKAYGTLNIKWLYVSHIIIFEAGSALCGAAPTMNAMIVGRAIA